MNNKIPTLTSNSIEYSYKYDKILSLMTSKCSLCDETKGNDYMFDIYNRLSQTNEITSCCQNIFCPNCLKIDEKNNKFVAYYLFITDVIYLQLDEEFDDEIPNDISIQYNWVLCGKYDPNIVNYYSTVTKNFNNYDLDDKKTMICNGTEYSNLLILCECHNCGFKCSARNYMDS